MLILVFICNQYVTEVTEFYSTTISMSEAVSYNINKKDR